MPACSKILTLMSMGRRSGSLFNHTPSLQLSICDWTRFMTAVASSLTFSLWIGVRNSLLKRPNQHRFVMCDKARFRLACSNIKKKPLGYKLRPARQRLGEFQICMFQYPGTFSLCIMTAQQDLRCSYTQGFKFRTYVYYDSAQYVF